MPAPRLPWRWSAKPASSSAPPPWRLQEQLMTKDLPALARSMDQPFAYALAKGRGRYVCKVKLERLVGSGASEDDLFDDDLPQPKVSALSQEAIEERRQALFESMAHKLAVASWDGDRDNLADTPDPRDWSAVAPSATPAPRATARATKSAAITTPAPSLAEANVIVANHDLVLASLGMKTLPDLDNCLVVFDEGHHLPAVALDQFSSAMDLSNLRWLDKLPKTMTEVAGKLALHLGEDVQTVTSQLKGALTTVARMAMDLVWAHTGQPRRPRRRQRRHAALCQWRVARSAARAGAPNSVAGHRPV